MIFGKNGRSKIAEHKAISVLRKYKWFIAPSMPINIVFRIVKLAETKGRHDKEINDLFVNYFSGIFQRV